MELENSFVVPADIETAWKTLLDVEAIAPCMPGATLDLLRRRQLHRGRQGEAGTGHHELRGRRASSSPRTRPRTPRSSTPAARRPRARAPQAHSSPRCWSRRAPNSTRANIVTDLTVTGKAAQFGKGVMADVSKRLIDQFAGNLEQVIVARQGGRRCRPSLLPLRVARPSWRAAPAPAPVMNNEASTSATQHSVPVLKRVVPVVIGVVVVGGIIWWLGHPLVRSKACARSRNTRTVRKSVRHEMNPFALERKGVADANTRTCRLRHEPLRSTTPSPCSRSMATRLDSSPAATASSR